MCVCVHAWYACVWYMHVSIQECPSMCDYVEARAGHWIPLSLPTLLPGDRSSRWLEAHHFVSCVYAHGWQHSIRMMQLAHMCMHGLSLPFSPPVFTYSSLHHPHLFPISILIPVETLTPIFPRCRFSVLLWFCFCFHSQEFTVASWILLVHSLFPLCPH